MHGNADLDGYEGCQVQGWSVYPISPGQVVYEEGRIVASAGRGGLVKRLRFQRL